MIDVEVAITIRRPRRDVAKIMFNPRYDAEWISGVVEGRCFDAGPVRRGARLERVTRRMGRRSAEMLEVVDHVPERAMELVGQPPLEQRLCYTLEGIPEGTIARIRACRHTNGRIGLPAVLRATLLRRSIIRDLDQLKWLVEAGEILR